ncbi:MAG: hypothetical protein U0Q19_07645 [Kineosporiaceae bacterium]
MTIAVVLDNEAAQALTDPRHAKHRRMLAILEAVAGRNRRHPTSAQVVVPTAVRLEALLDRRRPTSSNLGRLRVKDRELTSARADRCVELRSAAAGSTVDATVAQAAEELAAAGTRTTIVTTDLTDILRLVAASQAPQAVNITAI